MKDFHIPPNKPVRLALKDPNGEFDTETQVGRYQTTQGELLTLPRAAVVALNMLEPAAGEEIEILKTWSGKRGESASWSVRFFQDADMEAQKRVAMLPEGAETSESTSKTKGAALEAPTPIRRPSRQPGPEVQPRLFDCAPQGNGTYGPAPRPRPALSAVGRRQQIPANVAVREILEFINTDPSTRNWSGDSRQDLASTILIASFKAGYIGLWERSEE